MSGGEESKLVTPITPPQLEAPPGDDAPGEFASPVAEAAANSNCYQDNMILYIEPRKMKKCFKIL